MKKLMNILMLSCKKATELIEKKSVVGLSVRERIQLKMHTSMCNACQAYEGQSKTIDHAIAQYTKVKEKDKANLSDDVKARILSDLEEK